MSLHIFIKEGGQIGGQVGGQVHDLIDRDGATRTQYSKCYKKRNASCGRRQTEDTILGVVLEYKNNKK